MNYVATMKASAAGALLAILTGCIGVQTLPDFARSGDVVNVVLGGVNGNIGGQLIVPSDLVVSLTDSTLQQHTPQVLGVYRAYPDHTSRYSVTSQDRGDPNYGSLNPHDGALWASIALLDSGGNPLPLATGTAELSISSSKLPQGQNGNYVSLPLEIVPGQSDPLDQFDLQFQAYESLRYLTIKPDTTPVTDIGGAQIEIVFDSSLTLTHPFELRAVPINHNPNMSLIQSVTDNGDNTKTLKIFLTNPNGFVSVANWMQGQSTFEDLALGITSADGLVGIIVTNAVIAAPGTMDLISVNSYYVDLDGNPIVGVNPILVNEFSGI